MSETVEPASTSDKLGLAIAAAVVGIPILLFAYFLGWDSQVTALVVAIAELLTAVVVAWIRRQRSQHVSIVGPSVIGLAAAVLLIDTLAGMIIVSSGGTVTILILIVAAIAVGLAGWTLAIHLGPSPYAMGALAVAIALAARLVLIFVVFRGYFEELGEAYGVDLIAASIPFVLFTYAASIVLVELGVWVRVARGARAPGTA